MTDGVLVSIGGEEIELRPISARQYLSARMEAEQESEIFGEDKVTKAVLVGASLLAKGLFFNNERLFDSMDDVLDALSAEEIVTTAGYIDIEPGMKTKIIEAVDVDKAENLSSEKAESDTRDKADVADSVSYLRRTVGHEQSGLFTVYSGSQMRMSGVHSESNISPRSDMRRISDFFQRDSRRYDGIISSY